MRRVTLVIDKSQAVFAVLGRRASVFRRLADVPVRASTRGRGNVRFTLGATRERLGVEIPFPTAQRRLSPAFLFSVCINVILERKKSTAAL